MKYNKQNNSASDEQKAECVLRNAILLYVIVVFGALFLTVGWDLAERYIY